MGRGSRLFSPSQNIYVKIVGFPVPSVIYITDSTAPSSAQSARADRCSLCDARMHRAASNAGKVGRDMPIAALLAHTAFDPDTIALLASAFDTAWETVKKSDSAFAADSQAESTRELLAQRIIATARKGERNEQRLVSDA